MSRDLFGTDGVRGLAGEYPLDEVGARRIGMAVGAHFAKPGQQIVIGCDPRQSSELLVAGLTAGLNAVGVDVTAVGVIPTPGLAYLTRENDDFVAGVMVTASHNPYQYNGVKVFDRNGDKLADETEVQLNTLIEDGVAERSKGSLRRDDQLIQAYEDFLIASASGLKLNGARIGIDSANGAASGLAERVFRCLGADVVPMFDKPDGQNINANCGATSTKELQQKVIDQHLYLGIALDGDADRLVMVDGHGREVRGDHILYILAVTNQIPGVVATLMSNFGLEAALRKQGIELEQTAVGDRYVLEALKRTGFKLGGEQSGHIILPDLLMTGDGLLAAVQVVRVITHSDKRLADWCDEVNLLPQALVNISMTDKSKLDTPEVQVFIAEQTERIGSAGRLLIRPSGTEPLARVMVEAPNAETIASEIAHELEELLG